MTHQTFQQLFTLLKQQGLGLKQFELLVAIGQHNRPFEVRDLSIAVTRQGYHALKCRCNQLYDKGLLAATPIHPTRYRYSLTDKGLSTLKALSDEVILFLPTP